jgi:hypothetical protein
MKRPLISVFTDMITSVANAPLVISDGALRARRTTRRFLRPAISLAPLMVGMQLALAVAVAPFNGECRTNMNTASANG